MKRCVHHYGGVDLFVQYDQFGAYNTQCPSGEPISWRCLECKEYASLGPANDVDPNVAIEIRAAEIAYEVEQDRTTIRDKYNTVRSDVGGGWWVHQMDLVDADTVSDTTEGAVGYLARAIVEHDKEQS